jgi:hypothetical protein
MILSPVVQQPKPGLGRLIVEVSRSHTLDTRQTSDDSFNPVPSNAENIVSS